MVIIKTTAALSVLLHCHLHLLPAAASAGGVQTDDPTFHRSPPMGYSAWKAFTFEANETDIKAAADGLVASGMHAAGYRTLSLDGGWWGGGKSGKVRRNASGFFTVNDTKFPCSGPGGNGGLLSLSRYVTDRGFQFGLYTSAAKSMCSKDSGGSAGNEEQDAALFQSWNVSLMKLDMCGSPAAQHQAVMTKWRRLYDQLSPDRKIMLFNSLVGCSQYYAAPATKRGTMPAWCYATSTTMYQPEDGNDMWDVIIERHNSVRGRGHLARPGSWLDPGFLPLDIGDNYFDNSQRSLDQNRAVMSL